MSYIIVMLLVFALASCDDHEEFSRKSDNAAEDMENEISGSARIARDLDYKDESGRLLFPKGIMVDYIKNDSGYFLVYHEKRYPVQKELLGENNELILKWKGAEIKGQLVFEKIAGKVSMVIHTNDGGIKRIAAYNGMSVDLYAMRDLNSDGCSDFIIRVLNEPEQDLAFSISSPDCKYTSYYLLSNQKESICNKVGIADSECDMVLFEASPFITTNSISVQLVSADLPTPNNSVICAIKLTADSGLGIGACK